LVEKVKDTKTQSLSEDINNMEIAGGLEGVLGHNVIIVTRSIEWGNIILGFEQANKYTLTNEQGETIGYLAEETTSMSVITRQILRTHR